MKAALDGRGVTPSEPTRKYRCQTRSSRCFHAVSMALRMEPLPAVGALAAEDRAHRRIQHLCNGLVGVLHHPRNGFPEVCVAPEFGRNVQGKQQIGHLRLRVGRRYQRRADMAAQVADSGRGSGDVAGLSHHVAHAKLAEECVRESLMKSISFIPQWSMRCRKKQKSCSCFH